MDEVSNNAGTPYRTAHKPEEPFTVRFRCIAEDGSETLQVVTYSPEHTCNGVPQWLARHPQSGGIYRETAEKAARALWGEYAVEIVREGEPTRRELYAAAQRWAFSSLDPDEEKEKVADTLRRLVGWR